MKTTKKYVAMFALLTMTHLPLPAFSEVTKDAAQSPEGNASFISGYRCLNGYEIKTFVIEDIVKGNKPTSQVVYGALLKETSDSSPVELCAFSPDLRNINYNSNKFKFNVSSFDSIVQATLTIEGKQPGMNCEKFDLSKNETAQPVPKTPTDCLD